MVIDHSQHVPEGEKTTGKGSTRSFTKFFFRTKLLRENETDGLHNRQSHHQQFRTKPSHDYCTLVAQNTPSRALIHKTIASLAVIRRTWACLA